MQKNKLEAKKSTALMKWLKYNMPSKDYGSYGIEVKVERGKKFYYSSGSFQKELHNLIQTQDTGIIFKHSDYGGLGTIYDITSVKGPSYLVIFFGDTKKFYMIDIKKIETEIEAGEKGLIEERAMELAYKVDFIK